MILARTIICSIYDERPEMCRNYPARDGRYIPPSCSFFFPGDGTRRGSCDPKCEAACCRLPRVGGEPLGLPLEEELGGLPCKFLALKEEDDAETEEKE